MRAHLDFEIKIRKNKVYALFYDLNKAYDNVDRGLLKEKLQILQVSEEAINSIMLTMTNQTTKVA